MRSAFITLLWNCKFLVDHGWLHFWTKFGQKGSKFCVAPRIATKIREGSQFSVRCRPNPRGFALSNRSWFKSQKNSYFWQGFRSARSALREAARSEAVVQREVLPLSSERTSVWQLANMAKGEAARGKSKGKKNFPGSSIGNFDIRLRLGVAGCARSAF